MYPLLASLSTADLLDSVNCINAKNVQESNPKSSKILEDFDPACSCTAIFVTGVFSQEFNEELSSYVSPGALSDSLLARGHSSTSLKFDAKLETNI